MRTRTRQGQTTPSEADETVRAFATKVSELMVTHGIEKIYNEDQTGVFFEYVPKMTVNDKEKKTLWVSSGGKDKERLTAMLLGDSEGTNYSPLIVVHTTKSKRVEQAVENDS
uniref:AlNc14C29G2738 protein n=1 Tax=Albugo laibachii Nc14 TaxID=890382 RepID=F0W7B8_9STRA|nr:AlNc14C29G2738 [Albugo laibachii Nc14]|eukprot:CCA17017.1 AlNc14C29G2738 [Albugo laibachii Nc14]